MNDHQQYIEFLTQILLNAKKFKKNAADLLGLTLKDKKKERLVLIQFLLYSCIEECGKFFIVQDLFPQMLSEFSLKKAGFYDHCQKIKKVIDIPFTRYGLFNLALKQKISSSEYAKFFKDTLREPSLYVDYSDQHKILVPTVNENGLINFSKLVKDTVELCKISLEEFKRTPLFHG